MKRYLLVMVLGIIFTSPLQADYIYPDDIYPFEIFTTNGDYNDSTDVILSVEFLDAGPGLLDVNFYNYSFVECTIASVYFDDANLLSSVASITGSDGVSFSQPAIPSDLPSGSTANPSFVTTLPFSAGAYPPPAQNGVDPNEWLQITFNLQSTVTFQNVIDELKAGNMRVGAHIISLPDGSSESAVNVPEPATICLLGFGGLLIRRNRNARARVTTGR